MELLGNLTDTVLRQKPTALKTSSKLPEVADDPATEAEITEMLAVCYHSTETYGLEPDSVQVRAKVFAKALARYPRAAVREAFFVFLHRNKRMPCLSDVVDILDPPEPVPDKAVYVELCKRPPEIRSEEDWAFIESYERWARKNA